MSNDIVTKECRAFQWIGQSIATCDGCGKPIFEHDGESRSHGGPFSGTFLLKPFDEAVIANWIINEWIDRQRASYLLSVTEQIITSDIVAQSQQHGTQHDKTGTDEEYIEHLELKLDKANDEIQRLCNIIKAYVQAEREYSDDSDNVYNLDALPIRDAWREAWIDLAREADRD